MSLVALVIRIATVRALRGRTFAEELVFDSKINPVNLVSKDEQRNVIVVTTDDDNVDITGRDLRAGDHKLELVIETAVTQKASVDVADGEATEVVTIPATDAGLETTVGIIGYQIAKALSADGGIWGDIWRTLVVKVHSISSRRGADDANGVRYAARQFIYVLDHIAEPTPGEKPSGVWVKVLDAMKADPEFAKLAKVIEAEISGGDFLPWELARGHLGLANDETDIIGSKPVEISEIVPLAAVEMTDSFSIDEQKAVEVDGPEKPK